jgi:4-amino-4-deoxy-L-arabinose transferase-like glycosyltransferase
LVPFLGKAFHLDDPLFIWAAQQITKHPFDPYGFEVVWYAYRMPMSEVAQNPPLASYFAALVGSVAGWSETALHFGFILSALGVVLGTYSLALRFTQRPLIAAAATLLAPGFLISATGLMCDTMMLALWVLAAFFWVEGLDEPDKPLYLAISSFLIAACALTKYFGVSLIPLLLVYSLVRKRRLGSWAGFLLVPLFIALGYEFWTRALYGRGLLSAAFHYTGMAHGVVREELSVSGQALVGVAFAGGCALPALTFIPVLWSRKQVLVGGILSALLGFSFFRGWINLGPYYANANWVYEHMALVSSQMFVYLAGGISVLGLAIVDLRKKRDAASLLLFLWVAGTLVFAVFLNWVVTARSILPLVPAAAILIARRLDERRPTATRVHSLALVIPLMVSGVVSLWAASGDTALANTARTMANYIHQKTRNESRAVEFQGHWGFQYYMQLLGARPLEIQGHGSHPGDLIVIPKNNVNIFPISLPTTEEGSVDIDVHSWAATMSKEVGAGFYFSGWGPLPFALGPVPPERYYLLRVTEP